MSPPTITTTTSNNNNPKSLLIFTTSQIPLGIKYPHPRKPTLVIPPLVHRSLHSALDSQPPSIYNDRNSERLIIPHPDSLSKFDIPSHPTSIDINVSDSGEGSSSTVSDYELTIKLHLVGSTSDTKIRVDWIKESLSLLEKHKGFSTKSIDTLLLGFKGMDYRGNKTIASEFFGCGSEGLEAPNTETISEVLEKEILDIWDMISIASESGSEGVLGLGENTKLGTMYSTFGLLKKLVEQGSQGSQGVEGKDGLCKKKNIKVNSLDTPDCHHLPKEYTQYAKENNVELWAGGGGEGSDPLPSTHLHNLLQEFIPKFEEVINDSNGNATANGKGNGNGDGMTKLNNLIAVRDDGLKFVDSAEGVDVKWVLGYTLLSKTRNVVHDKGYLISADFI